MPEQSCRKRPGPGSSHGPVEVPPDETVLKYLNPPPLLLSGSLDCSICLELLCEPVTLSACGHSFCRQCAIESLKRKRQCPNCRKGCVPHGSVESLFNPNFIARDTLDELRVYCRWGMRADNSGGWEPDPGGCAAVVGIATKIKHEQECEHRRLKCQHTDSATGGKCQFESKCDEMRQHQEECKLMRVSCGFEGCAAQPSKSRLLNHRQQCEHRPAPCPNNCGEDVSAVALTAHRELCLQQEITCRFVGCGVRMRRAVQMKHDEESMRVHIAGMQQEVLRVTEQNVTLEQTFTTRMNAMQQQFDMQLHQLAANYAASVSIGAVQRMYHDDTSPGSVVQVLDIKKLWSHPADGAERFRLVVSDGQHYQQAMVATQLSSKISSGQVQKLGLIKLTELICNKVQNRTIIIILGLEVVSGPIEQLGEPVNVETGQHIAPAAQQHIAPAPQQHRPEEAGLNAQQRQVLSVVTAYSNSEPGVSIQQLRAELGGISQADIRSALNFLSNEGHLYSTIDEDHFMATSMDIF